MLKLTDEEIEEMAYSCSSISELSRKLNCSGAENHNINGRDLFRIRKALGFTLYASFSGHETHGGRSPYYILLCNCSLAERKKLNKVIKMYGNLYNDDIEYCCGKRTKKKLLELGVFNLFN